MSDTLFKGRSLLITGGLCFIGSNLPRRLVELRARVTLEDASWSHDIPNPTAADLPGPHHSWRNRTKRLLKQVFGKSPLFR